MRTSSATIASLDLARRRPRRLEHQAADQLGGAGRAPDRARARAAASRIAVARGSSPSPLANAALRAREVRARELAAQREVAIAVEEALHAIAELARASRAAASRSIAVACDAQRVELRRDVAIGRAQRRPRVDAGERALHARVAARVERLAGEDLEQEAAERVDVGARVDIGSPRTCSGAM